MISIASTVAPPEGWYPVEDLTKSAPAASAARQAQKILFRAQYGALDYDF